MSRRARIAVSKRPRAPAGSARLVALVAVALLAAIALVYSQVRHYGFAPVDDTQYVVTNVHVIQGMTWANLGWAFTTGDSANWHPLTWLSYLAEVTLFGVSAGREHVTNVLLHACSTLLLFGWLRQATGSLWRSAATAALFALHPLHVESVAWISERKDVLSMLFWMLSLWAYTSYVRHPRPGRYLLVLLWFACGLMAKPMVVTLPFVLLLLDVWPLGRVIPGAAGARAVWFRLAREKVPFLLLSAASSVVTFLVQQRGGAMNAAQIFPLGLRLENAVVSPVIYLWQMLWPMRLIVFYVHPDVIPVWQVVAAVGLLAGVSLVALRSTQRPYFAVGWFWYLGTLLPVSGVVQVGMQARADRYTYLPLVGILIVLSWGVADLLSRWQIRRVIGAPAAIVLTIACGVLSYRQVGYWQDGATLWGHAAAVTAGVPGAQARFELAKVLAESGRSNEAIPYLDTVIQIIPTWGAAHGLRGMALMQVGRNPEAIDEYMIALRLDPNQPEIQTNLGVVLGNQGRIGEALPHFAEAVRMKPELDSTHVNLGVALMRVGRRAEAAEEFSAALRINPANALARQMLDAIKK